MDDELLTPTEAAQYLRTTRNTVYRWLRGGTLNALKVGGVWRISKHALDARSAGTVGRGRGSSARGGTPLEWSDILERILKEASGHWIVVTASPDDVLDVDSSFLNKGLAAGYRVVKGSWWQDSDEVRRQLGRRGLDVEALERSGALVVMDVAAQYRRSKVAGVVAEWERLLEDSAKLGFRGLWKSGSPVLDGRVPFEGVVRLEEAAGEFFHRPGAYAICPIFTCADHPQWHSRLVRLLGQHEAVVYRTAQRAVLLRPGS